MAEYKLYEEMHKKLIKDYIFMSHLLCSYEMLCQMWLIN